MRRDAIRTRFRRHAGGTDGIWMGDATGVADGRDVINIDAKA